MENSNIQQIENEILEEFELFNDWTDKYEYIIELGKKLPLIDPEFKIDENKVQGCQSQVWLKADIKNGRIFYKADSDAIITKGLISLLIRVLSNQRPEDILNARLDFIEKIGLKEHLSPTRANGLTSMIIHMKSIAQFELAKN
jgi:cysteine desulfuration protein SufE